MSRVTNTHEHSLSGLRAWAISLGCAVGWGAFVMPGTLFLPTGGTLGSLVALCAGGAAMAVIALCVSYLCGKEPNARGISGLVELVLGSDHAFLCSWTMVFAYAAIIWANCTSVVLLFRYLVGPMLQVGYLYQIGGYSVYTGEIVVTLLVICAAGLLSLLPSRYVSAACTCMGIALVGGTVLMASYAFATHPNATDIFLPAYPLGSNATLGILRIFALAPWAFVGFESVVHSSLRQKSSCKRLRRILLGAIVASTLIYLATTVLAVMGTPIGARFRSWYSYVKSLDMLR